MCDEFDTTIDIYYKNFYEKQCSNFVIPTDSSIADLKLLSKSSTSLNPLEYVEVTADQWQSLVSWLYEIRKAYDLSYSVLYISTSILNKVLCQRALRIGQLQPYAAVCILIASMHEGSYPAIQELVYLCDGLCSANTLQKIVSDVLQAVDYQIVIFDPRTAAGILLCNVVHTSEQTPSQEFYEALDFVLSVSLTNRSSIYLPAIDFADAALKVVAGGLNSIGNEAIKTVALGVSTYMKMQTK